MGRHFERQDSGYSCFSGFLHMEAMHTNPIIICFCSILYYKDLSEHLRRYKKQRRDFMNGIDSNGIHVQVNKFTGRLSDGSINLDDDDKMMSRKKLIRRNYNTRVVMRWHLYLRMSLNKDIIKYRKMYINKNKNIQIESLIGKIKKNITNICNRKEESKF